MVFVTVGNATQLFERLVFAVEEAAGAGLFGEENVLIQAGSNIEMATPHCRKVRVMAPIEFQSAIERASVVISHCGAGTLFHAIRAGHCPIVMPRLPRFREGLEDQTDLLLALEREGRVIGIHGARSLADAVREVRQRGKREVREAVTRPIVRMVGEAIAEILAGKYR